jgi:hypothetical protein
MTQSRHQAIRKLLLASEDGLTTNEIADHFSATHKTICKTLKAVYGVYIDRWTGPTRGQYSAVYMCADIPEDAPHPTPKQVEILEKILNISKNHLTNKN